VCWNISSYEHLSLTHTHTGTKLNHAFTFPDVLLARLRRHYKSKLRSKWRSIFASLDAIGNPFLLMESFEQAGKDLISETVSAKNPFLGVAKGAASFSRNVSHGILSFGTGITGTMTSGLSAATFDKKYIEDHRRSDILDTPENALDGVAMGMKRFGKGMFEGITGIVTKPVKGARSGGVGGFFKGLGKGLIGLPVKPIVGIMGATNKMLEGVRNTTKATSESRKVANHVRLRRMTYGPRPCIRIYDEADATAAHVLGELQERQRYLYLDHVEFERCVMFATTGELICVDFNGDMQWNVEWPHVLDFIEKDHSTINVKFEKIMKETKNILKKKRRKQKVAVVVKSIRCKSKNAANVVRNRLLSAREMAMLYVSLK
jgi:hypothetical protein